MTMKNTCEGYCDDVEKVQHLQAELETVNIKKIAQLFKVLAEENRAKIIYSLLKAEELCVCDLANITGMTTANASHHLRTLHGENLVKFRKEGRLSYYSLDDNRMEQLFSKALAIEERVKVNV